MTDLLFKILEHVPELAVLLFVVIVFLKYQERREKSNADTQETLTRMHQARTAEFISTVKELNQENHEARARSAGVIEKNIQVTTDNSSALRELGLAFKSFETELRRALK